MPPQDPDCKSIRLEAHQAVTDHLGGLEQTFWYSFNPTQAAALNPFWNRLLLVETGQCIDYISTYKQKNRASIAKQDMVAYCQSWAHLLSSLSKAGIRAISGPAHLTLMPFNHGSKSKTPWCELGSWKGIMLPVYCPATSRIWAARSRLILNAWQCLSCRTSLTHHRDDDGHWQCAQMS